jgi:ABC-type transport system involved in multi-copper enzyme maturation permease subunit
MINSFKAEWRKLRQRPAVWVLGGIMLVALILFGYAFNWIQLSFPSKNFHPEGRLTIAQLKTVLYPINFVKNSLEGVGIVGSILTLILGALVVGSEFGWGTVKTVYTQRPGRLQTLAGQVAVVSVIAAIFTVAFYSVAALASLGIALGDHATITWPATIDILKALGATWLIFESWSLFGMTLAFLFRQSAMAIGIGLAYVLAIEGILFRLLGGFDAGWVTTIEKFFLGQNAGALIRSFGQPFPNPGQVAPIVTAGVAVLVLVIYSLVFTGVTSLVVRTRDVN